MELERQSLTPKDQDYSFVNEYMFNETDKALGVKIQHSYFHTGSIGDVWASLPAVFSGVEQMKKKATYYLRPNVPATYYEGAVHPTLDKNGENVMLNEKMIEMMIPLLKAQPYIEDAIMHTTQKFQVPLNMIRHTFVNMPNHDLRRWYFFIFPNLWMNIARQYIFVPKTDKDFGTAGKVIVARTERYHADHMSYYFLQKYQDKIIFAGTELEYKIFCARYELDIPRLVISDFLELAQALSQSLGLMSNQTMIFQIAEGMKVPRVVELCKMAPNVEPVGDMAFQSYGAIGMEYYLKEIIKKGCQ